MAAKKRKQPSAPKESPAKAPELAVVGMGASAGGLDAFKKFFDAMPADSGLAFVLIQHLDPTHESMMVELLAKHTAMPVAEVNNQMPIEANHVYIAPASKYVVVRERALYLTEPLERRGLRMPVDYFLRSLADDLGEKAIGIILSGTGTGGTLGLRAVKEHGGMAMVQEPKTAAYDGMPRSAVATGLVDYVLPVEKMPEVLVRYVQHPYINGRRQTRPPVEQTPDHLNAILALLRARTRRDFRCYKKGTLTRRIERRMGLNHVEEMEDYLEYLRRDAAEIDRLFKDLLIGVTGFFRELEAWQVLRKEVLATLVSKCAAGAPIRVWAPGCSTGEEAYSLTMLLLEQAAAAQKNCTLQIFASDIDEEALEFARVGIYPESIAADVPPERLERFFTKVDEHNYQVTKQLRDPVVFAVQNLIGDAPFSKLDLISCRNLLIYLEPEVQEKIISLFHLGLKPGGYLFLGTSEGIGLHQDLFQAVSKKWEIHRRIGQTRHARIDFPIVADEERRAKLRPPMEWRPNRPPGLAEITQQALLQEYAPASLLVNGNYEILYFYGPTSRYLELPTGAPTLELLALVQQGLRSKLRAALHAASKKDQAVAIRNLRTKRNGTEHAVTIAVRLLKVSHQPEGLLLVTFLDEPEPVSAGPADEPRATADEAVVGSLERELKTVREDLQSTIEELETSNEELKASNEEVMSINEELQSTNEELDTSKEELQSLNEELTTVNSQLHEKVQELEATANDLSNLLASSEIGTVFLDTKFIIKRFTPVMTRLLNLIPSDVGRPLGDIAGRFADDTLIKDAETVLQTLAPREKQVRTMDGHWYLRRIVPYRTEDNRIEGVVITFADVTSLKGAEEKLQAMNETLEQRVAQRTALVRLLQEVTVAANEASNVTEVIRWTLQRMGEYNGWHLALGYLLASDGSGRLELIDSWHRDDDKDYSSFIQTSRTGGLGLKKGLPESIVQTGQAVWIKDVEKDARFLRGPEAAALGLRTAFAFPILVRKEAVGVLEFFSEEALEAEAGLLEVIASLGHQLGRVVERHRLQQALAERIWVEQHRLGQELHDTVGQELTGLSMIARSLERTLQKTDPGEAEKAGQIADGLHEVSGQVREISRGLFPVAVDAQGLAAALDDLAEKTQQRHGIRCTFTGDPAVVVSDHIMATHLFRIAQEATANAVRHGKAKKITLSLKGSDHDLVLRVSNDGDPFTPDANADSGLGLRSMRYRASLIGGTMDIQTGTDGMTDVTCSLKR